MYRRLIDVEMTSCVYWVQKAKHTGNLNNAEVYLKLFARIVIG